MILTPDYKWNSICSLTIIIIIWLISGMLEKEFVRTVVKVRFSRLKIWQRCCYIKESRWCVVQHGDKKVRLWDEKKKDSEFRFGCHYIQTLGPSSEIFCSNKNLLTKVVLFKLIWFKESLYRYLSIQISTDRLEIRR